MFVIIKKEIKTYFTSFPGYIFLAGFVFLMALSFYLINIAGLNASFVRTLSNPSTLLVFLIMIPLLTMQLFCEETKQRTDQLLYTAPVSVSAIVIGKYLGAVSLFLIGIAVTLIFPAIIGFYGSIFLVDVVSVYIGFILMGFCFIAVGLFISCLTNSAAVAAVGSFAVFFLFYIMDVIAVFMPRDRFSSAVFLVLLAVGVSIIIFNATKNIYAGLIFLLLIATIGFVIYVVNPMFYDAVIFRMLNWFSVLRRFGNFTRGILVVADVVYYLAFSAAFVYLTVNTIEKRRWK